MLNETGPEKTVGMGMYAEEQDRYSRIWDHDRKISNGREVNSYPDLW